MTKEQFLAKVDELIEANNKTVREQANSLIKSGCVDLDQWDDNFALPKLFLCAALRNASESWEPLSKGWKAEIENIRRFV